MGFLWILVFLVGYERIEQDQASTSPLLTECLPYAILSREIASRKLTVFESQICRVMNKVVLAAGGAGGDRQPEEGIFCVR